MERVSHQVADLEVELQLMIDRKNQTKVKYSAKKKGEFNLCRDKPGNNLLHFSSLEDRNYFMIKLNNNNNNNNNDLFTPMFSSAIL